MARVVRLLVALAIGLLLCELGLRAAGWGYLRAAGRSGVVRAAGSGGLTVLCLGDSNTFGMYEETGDAYPARLQALLDERAPDDAHAVTNLGMPGMTTGHVLRLLARQLADQDPDAVLVLAGVNNGWGWRGDQEVDVAAPVESPPWFEELRLWKTARIVHHNLVETRAPDAPHSSTGRVRPGDFETAPAGPGRGERISGVGRQGEEVLFEVHALDENLTADQFADSVRGDLARIERLVSDAGAQLVLLTYAGDRGGYGTANGAIRAAADELDVPLVECARPMSEAVERYGYDELQYPDQHPKGAGYELVARLAFNALVESGLVDGQLVAAPLADLPVGRRPAPPVRLVGDFAGAPGSAAEAATVRLEITGEEPGRAFRVVLSGSAEGREARLHGLVLPVRDDELYRETVELPALQGTFDDDGAASLPVGAVLGAERLADLHDRPVLAAYVTYVHANRRRTRWFSDAAELRAVQSSTVRAD